MIERFVAGGAAAVVVVSAMAALIRGDEEFTRRQGKSGNKVVLDSDGRRIEYILSEVGPGDSSPLFILEHGLGSPLESWDWVSHLLQGTNTTFSHNRPGMGLSSTKLSANQAFLELCAHVSNIKDQDFVYVAHSFGSIVAMNALLASSTLRSRCKALILVDSTDPRLWETSRQNRESAMMYRQITFQELFSSITGMGRWVQSKVERDVAYRPDIQRSYVQTVSNPRTLISAQREFFHSSLPDVSEFQTFGIKTLVVSASDNVGQQRSFADFLGADIRIVPNSSHRSIIGTIECATDLVSLINEWLSSNA